MIRNLTLAVLFLAPVLPHAATPIDRAKEARATSEQASAARAKAADAQLDEEGDGALRLTDPADADQEPPPTPVEGRPVPGEGGKGTVPPPDTYTVRSGDTLWDLSGRFLNNPWYWPKVWSYNPEITNPHWIYPGNLVRFLQNGEDAPVQITPEMEEPEAAPVRELEDLSRADMKQGPSEEEQDVVAVAGPHRIGYVPPRTAFANHDAFVTPRELEESGSLSAAFEEKTMLANRDRAYAKFKVTAANVKVGETYSVYRTVREVEHPVTGDTLGYQTIILGAAKVIATEPKAATLIITACYEPIERGDLLGPWAQKLYRSVPPRPNARSMQGYIVASPVEILTQLAQHQVVFVDKGKADGVEEGNRFEVVRSEDPRDKPLDETIPEWNDTLPKEDVGALLVIDVKEHASAALVTRSLRELVPGDRVEMRAAK